MIAADIDKQYPMLFHKSQICTIRKTAVTVSLLRREASRGIHKLELIKVSCSSWKDCLEEIMNHDQIVSLTIRNSRINDTIVEFLALMNTSHILELNLGRRRHNIDNNNITSRSLEQFSKFSRLESLSLGSFGCYLANNQITHAAWSFLTELFNRNGLLYLNLPLPGLKRLALTLYRSTRATTDVTRNRLCSDGLLRTINRCIPNLVTLCVGSA